jgi:hypothetical protein
VIRNDNGVKNTEQGQYQRYPSDSSPGEYRLVKEERKCERGDIFFLRETEVERSGKQEPEVGEEVECCSSGMM